MNNSPTEFHPGINAIQRLPLRFTDDAIEEAFRDLQAREFVRPFRLALLTLMTLAGLVWWAVPWIVPHAHDARSQFLGPISATFAVFAVAWIRSQWVESFVLRQQPFMVLGAWTLAAIFSVSSRLLINGASDFMGLFFIAVHTINCYSMLRLRFGWACLAGAGIAVVYLLHAVFTGMLLGPTWATQAFALAVVNLFGMLISYQTDFAVRREYLAMCLLDRERARSESLLLNVLPQGIADRLKQAGSSIADQHAEVTVLFADIVGFTRLSAQKSPGAVVQQLDRIFTEFDALVDKHGLEKIKTIGDAYMAAAGLEGGTNHAAQSARLACDMLEVARQISQESGEELALRIGISSGPVVAGVIGRKKFIYDLWGDTVNTASRMQSHGIPGCIQCSGLTAALLGDEFLVVPRGPIPIDGKGDMQTFLVERPDSAAQAAGGIATPSLAAQGSSAAMMPG